LIAMSAPGTPVTLQIVRDGKNITLSTTIASPPPSTLDTPVVPSPERQIGLTYKTLTASSRLELGVAPETNGVVVTAVAPNSPADEANLFANDIIEQIGHKHITDADDASAALDAIRPDQVATIVVFRKVDGHGEEQAVDIKI
jgi:serine protease Do